MNSTIKKILFSAIVMIVTLYLIGAFYNVTFNIAYWLESTRLAVSLVSFLIVIAAIGVYIVTEFD